MTIASELIFLALIGLMIQQSSYGGQYGIGFFNNYLGFTLFLPILGFIMHFLYSKAYIKTKFSIITISIIISTVLHVLNFFLYPLLGGHTTKFYGIILIFGLPIAIVFGIIYALYFIKGFFNKPNSS